MRKLFVELLPTGVIAGLTCAMARSLWKISPWLSILALPMLFLTLSAWKTVEYTLRERARRKAMKRQLEQNPEMTREVYKKLAKCESEAEFVLTCDIMGIDVSEAMNRYFWPNLA